MWVFKGKMKAKQVGREVFLLPTREAGSFPNRCLSLPPVHSGEAAIRALLWVGPPGKKSSFMRTYPCSSNNSKFSLSPIWEVGSGSHPAVDIGFLASRILQHLRTDVSLTPRHVSRDASRPGPQGNNFFFFFFFNHPGIKVKQISVKGIQSSVRLSLDKDLGIQEPAWKPPDDLKPGYWGNIYNFLWIFGASFSHQLSSLFSLSLLTLLRWHEFCPSLEIPWFHTCTTRYASVQLLRMSVLPGPSEMNHYNILLTLMTKTHGSGDLGLAHIPASKEQTETTWRSSDSQPRLFLENSLGEGSRIFQKKKKKSTWSSFLVFWSEFWIKTRMSVHNRKQWHKPLDQTKAFGVYILSWYCVSGKQNTKAQTSKQEPFSPPEDICNVWGHVWSS